MPGIEISNEADRIQNKFDARLRHKTSLHKGIE